MGSKYVEEVGEFNLIRLLDGVLGESNSSAIACGIGDDAAVLRTGQGQVHVVSTDAFVEHYHFDRRFYTWIDVGYKAMAVNISDVAAMNAKPHFATVALALPDKFLVRDVENIYTGLRLCASQHGVNVVGGDTTRSREVMLSITIIGVADENDIVYRSGGQPGDLLCVTGTLGAAVAGLYLLQHKSGSDHIDASAIGSAAAKNVIKRHLRPVPRTDMVRVWQDAGMLPDAMIDISDGLAAEVHHICKASGCGAIVEQSALPIAEGVHDVANYFGADPFAYALSGGDDYELLFAASKEDCRRIDSSLYSVIGYLTKDRGTILLQGADDKTSPLTRGGHDHFSPG